MTLVLQPQRTGLRLSLCPSPPPPLLQQQSLATLYVCLFGGEGYSLVLVLCWDEAILFFFNLVSVSRVCVCRPTHATAHMWRSEVNLTFHLALDRIS